MTSLQGSLKLTINPETAPKLYSVRSPIRNLSIYLHRDAPFFIFLGAPNFSAAHVSRPNYFRLTKAPDPPHRCVLTGLPLTFAMTLETVSE
jgi:hypothetical protein